jgi:hypothetical protein
VSLVTLIVGETGKSSSSRARSRRPAGDGAAAPPGGTPGPVQWSCGWGKDGPGPVTPGCDGEPDLTLGLSPEDARSVQQGQLVPSVAFMQGRLKTSGDNELLLRVLAWTATTAFQTSLAAWAGEHGQLNSPAAPQ